MTTLRSRMIEMLRKLKASHDHPVWDTTLENMGVYISRALKIETATGQPIDEAYVSRLESYMPKPRKRGTMLKPVHLSLSVGMGKRRVCGLTDHNEVVIQTGDENRCITGQVILGACTQQELDGLIENLTRLRIHLP